MKDAIERLKGVRLVRLGETGMGLWRLPDRYQAAQMEILEALPQLPSPVLSLARISHDREDDKEIRAVGAFRGWGAAADQPRKGDQALESSKPQTCCDQVKFDLHPYPFGFARILKSEARERRAGKRKGGS